MTGVMTIDTLIAGDFDLFRNALAHLILPASLLGYFSLAYISRMTRSLMLGQLRQEYILTARVKGVPERRIIWKHAMGNILVPLLTVIALSYGNLLEGSVLTETVFAWRGPHRWPLHHPYPPGLPAGPCRGPCAQACAHPGGPIRHWQARAARPFPDPRRAWLPDHRRTGARARRVRCRQDREQRVLGNRSCSHPRRARHPRPDRGRRHHRCLRSLHAPRSQ